MLLCLVILYVCVCWGCLWSVTVLLPGHIHLSIFLAFDMFML